MPPLILEITTQYYSDEQDLKISQYCCASEISIENQDANPGIRLKGNLEVLWCSM